MYAYLGFII